MNKKIMVTLLAGSALLGGAVAGISAVASAQTTTASGTTTATSTRTPDGHKFGPGIAGKVTAVNGTTLTVLDDRSQTSYTVDLSAAKIMKASGTTAPAAATASDIAVGDTVMVRGTVSGTSVTATDVMDGIGPMGGRGHGGMGHAPMGQDGNITAINGTTITLQEEADEGGTIYTVDASNATVQKDGASAQITDLKVGDKIFVDGTVNGTSVTATKVMSGRPERGPRPSNQTTTQAQ